MSDEGEEEEEEHQSGHSGLDCKDLAALGAHPHYQHPVGSSHLGLQDATERAGYQVCLRWVSPEPLPCATIGLQIIPFRR